MNRQLPNGIFDDFQSDNEIENSEEYREFSYILTILLCNMVNKSNMHEHNAVMSESDKKCPTNHVGGGVF